jgi:hypothetical protein
MSNEIQSRFAIAKAAVKKKKNENSFHQQIGINLRKN